MVLIERRVKTLLELSADKVVDNIAQGRYQNLYLDLDVKTSNMLFKKFHEKGYVLSREAARTFRSCNVTQFEGIGFFNKNHIDLIHFSRNIEILELRDIDNSYADKRLGTHSSVSVILRDLLSRSSRVTLKKLTVYGYKPYKIDVQQLRPLAPNLQYLNLAHFTIGSSDLKYLGDNFRYLKELNIGCSDLRELTSIKYFKNLEVLNIQGLQLLSRYAIRNIFELKKLKVLIMSYPIDSTRSDTPNYFVDCGMTLPNLEFLDLSFSNITKENVEKLVRTHKNLKILSLIGTPLETNFTLSSSHKVQLLTVGSLRNCIESLKFFTQHTCCRNPRFDYSYRIYNRTLKILRDDYDQQSDLDLRELFHFLVQQMTKHRKCVNVQLRGFTCFRIMMMFNRSLLFTASEISDLISIIYSFELTEISETNTFDVGYHIIYRWKLGISWHLFLLERVSSEDKCLICTKSFELLTKFRNLAHPALSFVLNTLLEVVGSTENSNYHKVLVNFLQRFDFSGHRGLFEKVLKIVNRLARSCPEIAVNVSKQYIQLLMSLLEFFDEFWTRKEIINTLMWLLSKMSPDVLSTFFHWSNFEFVLSLMSTNDIELQSAVITFFIRIVDRSGKLTNRDCSRPIEEKLLSIQNIIRQYESSNWSYSSKTKIFEFISKSKEDSYAKRWARVILGYLEDDVQEPPKKKQRWDCL